MSKSLWILWVLLLIHWPSSIKGLPSSPAFSRRLLAQESATTEAASAPSAIDCSNNGTSSSCATPNSSATIRTSILPRSRTLTIVVVAIFVACIVMGFISVYARRFCITDEGLVTNYQNAEHTRNMQEIVASLPIVHYGGAKAASEEEHVRKSMRECAVCLSEFEEGEELRVLPACDHLFHKDCIDMWLFSHTTCPLCRISLVSKSKRTTLANSAPPQVPPPLAAGDQEPILSPVATTSTS